MPSKKDSGKKTAKGKGRVADEAVDIDDDWDEDLDDDGDDFDVEDLDIDELDDASEEDEDVTDDEEDEDVTDDASEEDEVASDTEDIIEGDESEMHHFDWVSLEDVKIAKGDKLAVKNPDVEDLVESIKKVGWLQPILVTPEGNILDGRRRYAAAIALEKVGNLVDSLIPVVRRTGAEAEALAANLVRKATNPFVQAQMMQKLLDDGVFSSKAQLARALGTSPFYVSNELKLLDIKDKKTQDAVISGDMPKSSAIEDLKKKKKEKLGDGAPSASDRRKAGVAVGGRKPNKAAIPSDKLPDSVQIHTTAEAVVFQVTVKVANDTGRVPKDLDIMEVVRGQLEPVTSDYVVSGVNLTRKNELQCLDANRVTKDAKKKTAAKKKAAKKAAKKKTATGKGKK